MATHGAGRPFTSWPALFRAWVLGGVARGFKIGPEVVSHAKAVSFQVAGLAMLWAVFAAILDRIARLRAGPQPA